MTLYKGVQIMTENIAVIGSGSMGIAMAVLLSGNRHKVSVWSPFEDEIRLLCRDREHKRKLPGIHVPENVSFTDSIKEVLEDSGLVVLAVPSRTIRENVKKISHHINKRSIIVSCTKGLEEDTCLTPSQVIKQELPSAHMVALSGPSHAEEIAKALPTVVVAASHDRELCEKVQDVFMSPMFRVYTNTDIIGVELGGAVKNIIALCAGISDGLGYGDNTKAALITRGIAEITRLGTAMGALPQTFSGLTGIGDLIVTCTSMHSRNRRAGILIGKGSSPDEALEQVGMVVEGMDAAKPAYKLSMKFRVTMPIVTEAYRILFEGKSPEIAVCELMARDKKEEMKETF
jgi:glycerol-3-phosphate dehydrogenase (NAD(P)+)